MALPAAAMTAWRFYETGSITPAGLLPFLDHGATPPFELAAAFAPGSVRDWLPKIFQLS